MNSSGSNSLSLYQLSGTSLASHPTCYWRIINSYNLQMTVQIQRSSMNYEDIYVLYSYNNSYYYMMNKYLANCSNSITSLIYTNVTSLYIKAKRLSTNSNYVIIVSSSDSLIKSSSDDLLSLIVLIVIIMSVLLFISATLIIIFIFT